MAYASLMESTAPGSLSLLDRLGEALAQLTDIDDEVQVKPKDFWTSSTRHRGASTHSICSKAIHAWIGTYLRRWR
jgi:hypothetical protein